MFMMDLRSSNKTLHKNLLLEEKPKRQRKKNKSVKRLAHYQLSDKLKGDEIKLREILSMIESEQRRLCKEIVELDKLRKSNQSRIPKTSVPKPNCSVVKTHTISQMSKKCFSDDNDKTAMDIDNPESVNKLDINLDLGLPGNENFDDEEFECD